MGETTKGSLCTIVSVVPAMIADLDHAAEYRWRRIRVEGFYSVESSTKKKAKKIFQVPSTTTCTPNLNPPSVNDVDTPTKSVATATLNSNSAPHALQNENPLNPLVPSAPTVQKMN